MNNGFVKRRIKESNYKYRNSGHINKKYVQRKIQEKATRSMNIEQWVLKKIIQKQ